jgi:hypothetical protein
VEIVKRSDRAKGFVVLSKRWIVGVSSEGHTVMSVKVRPEDSGFEAREAPLRARAHSADAAGAFSRARLRRCTSPT